MFRSFDKLPIQLITLQLEKYINPIYMEKVMHLAGNDDVSDRRQTRTMWTT